MVRASCLMSCCLLGAILLILPNAAYSSVANYRPGVQYEPEQIMDMLNRLSEYLDMERKMENYKEDLISSDKRGLDMGLNRGYSGALQAKHLMGVAAANYAAGPGRRRRDYN